ncbi:DUF1127 domain-containing protein [Oceaniglobus indicus]|uniref:DUF1127 domain-containing protein n=1 Tax=Oceaniglobus indicus TaxID=2047749 RepID=UPI0019D4DE5A|nr:DUF1127 domain-containing protein [Oceaniglobus indicus]
MHTNMAPYNPAYGASRDTMVSDGRTQAGGALRRWAAALARNWHRRRMVATLRSLDDATLRDIGIYRGDILNVVYGFDDRELGMTPFASAPAPERTAPDASFRPA